MYAPHNDVSVNDGPPIRRWSRKIIIQYYNTTVLIKVQRDANYAV